MSKSPWPPGWAAVVSSEDNAPSERARGYALRGQTAALLGLSRQGDEYLFRLQDGRVADVRLTWSVESDAVLPLTTTAIYPSFDAWSGRASGATGSAGARAVDAAPRHVRFGWRDGMVAVPLVIAGVAGLGAMSYVISWLLRLF